MDIKAIAFDTGGTVLDWHGGLVRVFSRVAARHDLTAVMTDASICGLGQTATSALRSAQRIGLIRRGSGA